MAWHEIRGHDDVVRQFQAAIRRGRLASTFLFVGPAGVGKHTFAVQLAQALLCERHDEAELTACRSCSACTQVDARSHPDLLLIQRPADKNVIPVELFIGAREKRMREGLCHDIALKPFQGGRKIAIIDDADFLNQEGANCLLKTLEEPPPRSILILVGTSLQKQLPTIRSRCQTVRFQALPETDVRDLLASQHELSDPDQARQLAQLGRGSLSQAGMWRDEAARTFRQRTLQLLSAANWSPLRLDKEVIEFMESGGKETSARRQQLRLVVHVVGDYYQQLLRAVAGVEPGTDREMATAVQRRHEHWHGPPEPLLACLDRCVDALEQIDANAHPATLVHAWVNDLWSAETG